VKTDRARAAAAVRMGLNLVHVFGHLAWPIMPTFARKIHEAIQPVTGDGTMIPWIDQPMDKELDALEPGMAIKPPDVLFAKITEEQVAEWTARFSGAGA
jgi:methionyl-tRNA synthetase